MEAPRRARRSLIRPRATAKTVDARPDLPPEEAPVAPIAPIYAVDQTERPAPARVRMPVDGGPAVALGDPIPSETPAPVAPRGDLLDLAALPPAVGLTLVPSMVPPEELIEADEPTQEELLSHWISEVAVEEVGRSEPVAPERHHLDGEPMDLVTGEIALRHGVSLGEGPQRPRRPWWVGPTVAAASFVVTFGVGAVAVGIPTTFLGWRAAGMPTSAPVEAASVAPARVEAVPLPPPAIVAPAPVAEADPAPPQVIPEPTPSEPAAVPPAPAATVRASPPPKKVVEKPEPAPVAPKPAPAPAAAAAPPASLWDRADWTTAPAPAPAPAPDADEDDKRKKKAKKPDQH